MTEKIAVPPEVLAGLEHVRAGGETNMLDRPQVMRLAHEAGYHDAVLWIEEHREEFARGIFYGFEASDGGEA